MLNYWPWYSCCCPCPVHLCSLSFNFPVLFSSSKNILTLITIYLDWKIKHIPCRPGLLVIFVDWMDSVGSGCLLLLILSTKHLHPRIVHASYNITCAVILIPSSYTKYSSAISSAWESSGKCMLHYLYAEDLPQHVWIGLTTTKGNSSVKQTLKQRWRARMLFAQRTRGTAQNVCKNVYYHKVQ